MDYQSRSSVEPSSAAEIAATYQGNRSRFIEPEKRDLEILRVEIVPPDPPAQFRHLQRLADDIRKDVTDLNEVSVNLHLAGRNVTLESLAEVPPSGIENLGRAVAEAVKTAGAGGLSGPIQENSALLLIRTAAIYPARQLTFEEATPWILSFVEQQRLREARRAIAKQILAEQEIEIH